MNTQNLQNDQFDTIVVGRLFAADFAQPARDFDFYRTRSIDQIECAISNISSAHTYPEFVAAVVQANAFIDSAYHLELIDLSEKVQWVDKVHTAHKNQLIEA
ncbi:MULTISPECIES: hypothetical protein [unclassified Acinetobacter]|uniref:hypothetical protein n=1 Tax=unclassified Acinetobacter TaxID=196816 RepID=UPI0012506A2F|nr:MULTISPECIES: hypothetical protein [unclassified Acinetobacter]